MKVFDESDIEIGVVDSFYSNGVQEIIVIKGKTFIEVPFIANFIISINAEENKMVISAPVFI